MFSGQSSRPPATVDASLCFLAESQARTRGQWSRFFLFRRLLSSPTMCRFSPALSVPKLSVHGNSVHETPGFSGPFNLEIAILATQCRDSEPGRLGEHLAFKDRLRCSFSYATQTAFHGGPHRTRAFGQSSSDAQQQKKSSAGKGLFWAWQCSSQLHSSDHNCSCNKQTYRANLLEEVAGFSLLLNRSLARSIRLSGNDQVPSARSAFCLKLQTTHRGR